MPRASSSVTAGRAAPRSPRLTALAAGALLALVMAAGCGGAGAPVAMPAGEAAASPTAETPAPSAAPTTGSASHAPAESPAVAATPAAAEPTPTAAPTTAPAAEPSAAPATAKPRATPARGSIHLVLEEPIDVDRTLSAEVRCTGGAQYHMGTFVEVQGTPIEAAIDVDPFHGAGDYSAIVGMWVSTDEGTQGGEIESEVTIRGDLGGSADYSLIGSRGTVIGSIAWTCSP